MDSNDLAIWTANQAASNPTFAIGDTNYDGTVNSNDQQIIEDRMGQTLSAAPVLNAWSTSSDTISLSWDDWAVGQTGWRVSWSDDGITFNTSRDDFRH